MGVEPTRYRPVEGTKVPVYKWTRHFLVEKSAPAGSGEWIVEGEIPEPIVMVLQLYQYHNNLQPQIDDVHKAFPSQKPTSTNTITSLPNSDAMALFNKHAQPGNTKLDFAHFVTLINEVKPGLTEAETKLVFSLLDGNKDGVIDPYEFSNWFSELKEWGNDG